MRSYDSDDFISDNYENEQIDDEPQIHKPKRGPKKGKRQKTVLCKEFETAVIPLFEERNIPKTEIDNIISMAIKTCSLKVLEGRPNDLTNYIKEYQGKNKEITTIIKSNKGLDIYFYIDISNEVSKNLEEALGKFYYFEEKIFKLKEKYVWKCWSELDTRCKKIAQNIVYTKSLSYEEAENLVQDTALYFHHLHTKYDPFFLPGKTMPYVYYMLSMVRQKLRYHIQAYHLKKNKEDLKEEISDFDMPTNYILTGMGDIEDCDLRTILKEIEQELPSEKHKIVFEMLKDGHKQKTIAKAINYTQSWVSIIKKKIRASLLRKIKETSQQNLLEAHGIDIDNYKNENLENIWD